MITRGATLTSRMAVAFAILFAITACGGGGGGGDVGNFLPDTNDSSTYFLSLVLLDPQGNPTNTVTSAAPARLEVTITKKNKNGSAIADVVVSAQTDIGEVFPSSGTALTNPEGLAAFQIEAGNDKGAGTITATVDSEDGTFTANLAFQIGNSGLRLGYFDADGNFIENTIGIQPQATLASAGRAQIVVAIVDEEGKRVGTAESVRLSSGCLSAGQATLEPVSPLISGDGQVATTYSAAGCTGTDEITASLVGATAQAFGSISIAPPEATGLTFVSADPRTIVLRGTGGGSDRQDSSSVIFKVVDRSGSPVQGVNVNFSLTTDVGGLTVSPASALSASDGTVGVTVFSGDVATVVRVIAVADTNDSTSNQVATVSDVLTVTTGLPDQNSISLSVAGGFVVEDGFTIDGKTRTLTVRMADTFNNPVPNGTAAVFTTEFGAIDPSCETGIKNGDREGGTPEVGTCSVLWTSQSPRLPTLEENREAVKTINSQPYDCPDAPGSPGHNASDGPCPNDMGFTRGGRSTVLVTAIGQESFVDSNGNGIMDQNEQDQFDNQPEAFLDNNEDTVYTRALDSCQGSGSQSAQCKAGSEEQFTDFNSNGVYDLNDDPAVYNGLLCPPEGDGVWCSRELINVRNSTVLILSAGDGTWDIITVTQSGAEIKNAAEGGSTLRYATTYRVYISDIFNNAPPAGSSIAVSAGGDCAINSETSFTVPTTPARGAFGLSVTPGGVGTSGTVTVKVSPQGDSAPYSETWNCLPEPPPPPEDPNAPDGELGFG
jgi:hypothetical protein